MDESISMTLTQIDEVDSRQEEEEKKTTFLHTIMGEDRSADSNVFGRYNIQKSKTIYKELTEAIKEQEDLFGSDIERSVDDMNHLISKGIFANLGQSNQNGIHYFILFGYAYARIQDNSEKMIIRQKVTSMLRAISMENKIAFIYMHSGTSAMRRGALSMSKKAYLDLPECH